MTHNKPTGLSMRINNSVKRIINCTLILIIISNCTTAFQNPTKEHEEQTYSMLGNMLKKARPGDIIKLPAEMYLEEIILPPGVSLRGVNARKTIIIGSVTLTATENNPVLLSDVTLIHTGGRASSLVQCKGQTIEISHCFISSEGGFASINTTSAKNVKIHNNIIIGPTGDYAIFGRDGGKLEIINNTIIVQGFGVGLMDGSSAVIRNCLFWGTAKPAVVRTKSDYEISYSNICLSGGSFYQNHELINGNIVLRDPSNHPNDPTPPELTNKDEAKYDSQGLTFFSHVYQKSKDIDYYKEYELPFAKNSGSPAKEERNWDGTQSTLGAFGGPLT
jgi:hypothetical protein